MIDYERCFSHGWTAIAEDVNELAIKNGFWDKTCDSDGVKLALIHAEVSEVLEAVRKLIEAPSEKIPDFCEAEEELADVVIRVMDYAYQRKYNIVDAILAKIKYNESRPYKHSKRF